MMLIVLLMASSTILRGMILVSSVIGYITPSVSIVSLVVAIVVVVVVTIVPLVAIVIPRVIFLLLIV